MPDYTYYWYIRRGPRVNTLGIVNEDGDAVASGITVELRGEIVDIDQEFTNATELELREESFMRFVDGVLGECIKLTTGKIDNALFANFEREKSKLRGLNVVQRYGGSRLKPRNLRSDRSKSTTDTRERES